MDIECAQEVKRVNGMYNAQNTVILCGDNLTVKNVARIARGEAQVRITDDPQVLQRLEASCRYIINATAAGQVIYGVTTGFGGTADRKIAFEDACALQSNLLWFLKAGAGKWLPLVDVRAAMVLRLNSLLRGVSGIRLEILERFEIFLNAGVTPLVRELGSIGASGDLVPLAAVAGALIGLDSCFQVDFQGETVDCITALDRLGLGPISLLPKEGLALVNGTAMMTGIAVNCIDDAQLLLALSLYAHAFAIQGLVGTNQSFHPFIQAHKPHPGQRWIAAQMLKLLAASRLSRDELHGEHQDRERELIQDRYSLRCLAQYMGPIIDGLTQITKQIAVEINSASDNPLIDVENQASYHGGNFLGQYVGIAMDQLRFYIGLLAKHLDAQIALLAAPEFNNGLSAGLIGNADRTVNMGLKGLQIAGNSIMPLLTFLGSPLVDRFTTHAEQFNQNINSLGFGAANLARQSVELFQQYIVIALMFGVQAVDLRTYRKSGRYDARTHLSPATVRLYEVVYEIVGRSPGSEQAFIWNDCDQAFDHYIALIAADISTGSRIRETLQDVLSLVRSESTII